MTTRFIVVPGHSSSMNFIVNQLLQMREDFLWDRIRDLADEASFDVNRALKECMRVTIPANRYAQPLQFLLGYAFYTMKPTKQEGTQGVTGHSLGEFLAIAIAGSINWADGLRLVMRCGTVMDAMHRVRPGAMSALLGFANNEVAQICEAGARGPSDYLEIANINSIDQIVVSGDIHCLDEMEQRVKTTSERRIIRLGIRGAAHSSMYAGRDPMNAVLKNITVKAPSIPLFLSTVPGRIDDAAGVKEAIKGILVNRVNWVRTMADIYQLYPDASLNILFPDRGMANLLKNYFSLQKYELLPDSISK
ncbi:ACP S-malonyltransferase [Rothia dentocariosa]|uniref:ACP S-malonyltransferase n=1 Tax=Rothia dentocariosa TaxID=2047 RepID=UPI0014557B89|nr:acyltransferase domain-containing protein [Rothia dentocariosa]NLR25631.1 ACP S-malonyltransferase [Rothia dentocariosa]